MFLEDYLREANRTKSHLPNLQALVKAALQWPLVAVPKDSIHRTRLFTLLPINNKQAKYTLI